MREQRRMLNRFPFLWFLAVACAQSRFRRIFGAVPTNDKVNTLKVPALGRRNEVRNDGRWSVFVWLFRWLGPTGAALRADPAYCHALSAAAAGVAKARFRHSRRLYPVGSIPRRGASGRPTAVNRN